MGIRFSGRVVCVRHEQRVNSSREVTLFLTATETRSGPSVKSKTIVIFLATTFLVSSFLPYLAVGVGQNTNIPLSSFVGLALILASYRHPAVWSNFLFLLPLPAFATIVRLFLADHDTTSLAAYVTWFANIVPFAAAMATLLALGKKVLTVLSISLAISSALVLAQGAMLAQGVLPFLEIYNVPGYASVAANAQTIIQYNPRPFGLFPEPSFMAGTLALATIALLVLHRTFQVRINKATWFSIAVSTLAIGTSGSGSAIVSLVCVALLVARASSRGRALFVPLAALSVGVSVLLGITIASQRQSVFNWSWSDRFASIEGSTRLLASDWTISLAGIGRGMSSQYFAEGRVPLGGTTYYNILPDVYSTLGRIVLENGLIIGLALVLYLTLRAASDLPNCSILERAIALVAWLVIAGLTITYETAAWIWIFPGLMYGAKTLQAHCEHATPNEGRPLSSSRLPAK